jgi:hypothetical protein
MKKLLTITLFALIAIASAAQEAATFKFLGLPVDGKKSDMIAALKNKGFTYDAKNDVLIGKFNGNESNIHISENYGKVDRIFIADNNPVEESQIKIRFNQLIQQFNDNKKYFAGDENNQLTDKDDISYEINVNKKEFTAVYYFSPVYGWGDEDAVKFAEAVKAECEADVAAGKYEEVTDEVMTAKAGEKVMSMTYGQVWFRIADYYGKYYICLYYDNLHNRPNGEDL